MLRENMLKASHEVPTLLNTYAPGVTQHCEHVRQGPVAVLHRVQAPAALPRLTQEGFDSRDVGLRVRSVLDRVDMEQVDTALGTPWR